MFDSNLQRVNVELMSQITLGIEGFEVPLCLPADTFPQESRPSLLWENLLKPFNWNTFWKILRTEFFVQISEYLNQNAFFVLWAFCCITLTKCICVCLVPEAVFFKPTYIVNLCPLMWKKFIQ